MAYSSNKMWSFSDHCLRSRYSVECYGLRKFPLKDWKRSLLQDKWIQDRYKHSKTCKSKPAEEWRPWLRNGGNQKIQIRGGEYFRSRTECQSQSGPFLGVKMFVYLSKKVLHTWFLWYTVFLLLSGPLFKILKLKDQITLFNCLLIHDHSRNLLPSSFQNFFLPCTDLHDTNTRSHAGSLFVPHVNSKQYGRNSIKVSSILKWNHLFQVLNQNLLSLTKTKLEITLTNLFLNSYSP